MVVGLYNYNFVCVSPYSLLPSAPNKEKKKKKGGKKTSLRVTPWSFIVIFGHMAQTQTPIDWKDTP